MPTPLAVVPFLVSAAFPFTPLPTHDLPRCHKAKAEEKLAVVKAAEADTEAATARALVEAPDKGDAPYFEDVKHETKSALGEQYWGEYISVPQGLPRNRLWHGYGRWRQQIKGVDYEFHGRFLRDKFDLGVRTSGEVVCKGEWRDDVLNGLAVKDAWLVDDDDRRVSHTLAGRFKQEGKKRDSTTLGVCRERIGKREMAVDAGEFKVRRVHTHTHSVPHAMCFKDFVFLLPPPSCCPCTYM